MSAFVGQIGYALVPMIARGVMLGSDQPVFLHLLDIPPAAEVLNGVKMELIDAAFPLLKGMQYPSSEVNLQVNNTSWPNLCWFNQQALLLQLMWRKLVLVST